MSNTFITTTDGFTINSASTANYGLACSTYCVVGGPGNFGAGSSVEKIYTGLVPHFRARVTFFFMKIDNWNGESVIVTADTISLPTSLSFTSSTDSSVMKLCGTASNTEAIRPVDLVFSHNTASMDLKISTTLATSASVASWGIYKFSMSIDKCNSIYCTSCSGPNPTDCLSCVTGLFLQTSPGPSTCESLCPDGSYQDITTNECPACDLQCKKCSGATSNDCLACPTGKFLLVSGGTSTCVSQCPSNYYIDSNNNCVICDATCTTCDGGLPNDCLACTLPRYLMDSTCMRQCPGSYFGDNSTATCIQDCPDTTFGYNVSKICCPCSNCKKCVGFASNQCVSCTGTQLLQENSCVTTCSLDHYLNQANSSCDGIILNNLQFLLNLLNSLCHRLQ